MEEAIKEDTVLVILGASGDLARKKLGEQERRTLLPPSFRIVGFAPDEINEEDFNSIVSARAKIDSPRYAEQLKDFKKRCSYVSGHEGGEKSFQALGRRLDTLGENKKEQHSLFYMALPPKAFESASAGLKKFCCSARGDNRIIISMCECIGVEGRGGYFESSGTIRDVMQNRKALSLRLDLRADAYKDVDMMQILALFAMERPKSFRARDLCDEKTRVLGWMPPIDHQRTIIGQYARSADGFKPAFRDEDGVQEGSRCVTFCAAEARIENERWAGVPILLKAGKALDKSEATIVINFRQTPNASIIGELAPNRMTIRVQPDEAMFLTINALVPHLDIKTEAIDLDLSYRGQDIPEAYEALLLDACKGDFSRSVRAGEVDASWEIFTPLLNYLEDNKVVPREYAYGKLSLSPVAVRSKETDESRIDGAPRGPGLLDLAIALVVLETCFVALYFFSRTLSKTAKGWDVYLMLPAYIFNLGLITCVFIMIEHGRLGRYMGFGMQDITHRFQKLRLITAIVRLVIFYRLEKKVRSQYYDTIPLYTWTIVEPGVYLIGATLPFMRPLLRRTFETFKLSTLYEKTCEIYKSRFVRTRQTDSSSAEKGLDLTPQHTKGESNDNNGKDTAYVVAMQSPPKVYVGPNTRAAAHVDTNQENEKARIEAATRLAYR
ncbi:uncharacterized protein KY384_001142 [Bacidia gigantensis]|uniref:uncharacterized protein n=1 Tax=Bacidia gigantensis TaxID=2732470 RepID=UPI001D037B0D|nr:uncharacterized protein KY384_001142 [Bacidia gigantensis]KAG8534298.1 hypothetical protein KY384_001142 [Bacidia gigantensis]